MLTCSERSDDMPKEPSTTQDTSAAKAEAAFRAHLRRRGLKYTRERQAILQAVMRNEQHFEAEELLWSMRRQDVRVGKATIYRTLPLLVDAGIIREVIYGEKHAHYEHTFGHAPHDHMICRSCGQVIEFDSKKVLELIEQLCGRERFEPLYHRFQISGRCDRCRRRAAQHRRGASRAPRTSEGPARQS
jgi:Fur family ferric uptake transcriptional regulator